MANPRQLDVRDQFALNLITARLVRHPGEPVVPADEKERVAQYAYDLFDAAMDIGERRIDTPRIATPFGAFPGKK